MGREQSPRLGRRAPVRSKQSARATLKDRQSGCSRNIRPPAWAELVNAPSWLPQFGPMLGRYIDNRRSLTALEGAQISNDGPAVGDQYVRAVSHPLVFAGSCRVKNFAVGHLSQSFPLQPH